MRSQIVPNTLTPEENSPNTEHHTVSLSDTLPTITHSQPPLSELSIDYQNVRGLRTKTADLYAASYESEYDVIVLTETWLDDAISSTMLFDDNRFTVYRTDRSTTNSTWKQIKWIKN